MLPKHSTHQLLHNTPLYGKRIIFASMSETGRISVKRRRLSRTPELSIFRYSEHLPIHSKRKEIITAIRKNQVVIISGETGSGKTTQLPLICLEAGRSKQGLIGCTQPRRIAAISIAQYVALCTNTPVGELVGYKVRFHDQLSHSTRIKFMTDGILLAEISESPAFKKYDTLIIDEAHERSCNIDFILGYLRMIITKRPNLKVIISSATMDTHLFSRTFNNAPVIAVSGRLYPVDISYKPAIEMWEGNRMRTYADAVVPAVQEILNKNEPGDVLVFLPTAQDIRETVAALKGPASRNDSLLFPLYSRMTIAGQKRIFQRHKKRKIVIATNIAETSLTVPGIRYVIDSGLVRTVNYESLAGTSRMPIERISRASADQRAGRCGRVREGECIRLYSAHDYETRPKFTIPEIRRINLSSVILRMCYLGLGRAENFPFIQNPPRKALSDGYYRLRELGAISDAGEITGLGRKMAAFPLDPRIARILLFAKRFHALKEITIIAAALSVVDPRIENSNGNDSKGSSVKTLINPQSDFMTYVNIWDAYHEAVKGKQVYKKAAAFCDQYGLSMVRMREWIDVYNQIVQILKDMKDFRFNSKSAHYDAIHKSLLSGFMSNIATRQENQLYQGTREHDIRIFPGSALSDKGNKWVFFHELVETRRLFGRTAAVIRPHWIEELFGNQCTYSYKDPYFDTGAGIVRAREQVTYKGLTVAKNRLVNYGNKKPKHASKIFVKQALVEEKAGVQYRFIKHNREVREKIHAAQEKLRTKAYYVGDTVLESFYEELLPEVKSIPELNKAIESQKNDSFLCIDESELCASPLPDKLGNYPDTIIIGTALVNVSYAFKPDTDEDGATITIPHHLYNAVPFYYWDWLLPVYWRERIQNFARQIRKKLITRSLSQDAFIDQIHKSLNPKPVPFIQALCMLTHECFGIEVQPDEIMPGLFPDYLWTRVMVKNDKGVIIDSFRLPRVSPGLPFPGLMKRPPYWAPHCSQWEKTGIIQWDFGTIEKQVALPISSQVILLPGYMSLCREEGTVALRVFFSKQSAETSHAEGVRFLLENALEEELAWAVQSFSVPTMLIRKCSSFTHKKELKKTIDHLFLSFVLQLPEQIPYDKGSFEKLCGDASKRIVSAHAEICDLIGNTADEYDICKDILEKLDNKFSDPARSKIAIGLYDELDRYISLLFSTKADLKSLLELPRYLKALRYRVETGFAKPHKYRETIKIFNRFRKEHVTFQGFPQAGFYNVRRELDTLFNMIEEFGIALFAPQSLKTKFKVSEHRLRKRIQEIEKIML